MIPEKKIYKEAIVNIVEELNFSIKNLNKYISEGSRELNYVEKVVKPYKRAIGEAKGYYTIKEIDEKFLRDTVKHCNDRINNTKEHIKENSIWRLYYDWKDNDLDNAFNAINNLKKDLNASKDIQKL